ncbi:MAG: D-alanyl-D-alanine dipeptidase [Rickettsiales bacterium]
MLKQITAKNKNIILDLKYSTKQNFVKQKLYKKSLCYLHEDAYSLLIKASKIAQNFKLKLRIFDAFRPLAVQKLLFSLDQDFVSNPNTGSIPHCRGIAVDLTLTDQNNNDLDMGTEFDHFSKLAYHGNRDIALQAQKNRLLLLAIMTEAGWDFYRNEWWHYQLFNPRTYPVIEDFNL